MKMNKMIAGISLAAAALVTVPAFAAGDAAAGKEKSAMCVACHGPDGNSPTAQFPRIAGQHNDYMVRALKDYKSGARKNPIMAGIVAALTEEDMENLAEYFSSQSGLVTPPSP